MAELETKRRPALSADIIQRIKPVTLATRQVMDVPEMLKPLFPLGGVQRGTSLAFAGNSGWALAMAIMAEALGTEGWLGLVGAPDFGLMAAAEYGVRLDRILVVETPSLKLWPTVVASLLESVDVVAVAPVGKVGLRDARRLTARAREQSSVLLHLDGAATWPTAVDVVLAARARDWSGLGDGHGHLVARRVEVESTGRRSAARQTKVEVLLPGPDGCIGEVVPEAAVAVSRGGSEPALL